MLGEKIGTNQQKHVLDRRNHCLAIGTQQKPLTWLGSLWKRCLVGLRNRCICSTLPHCLSIGKTHTRHGTAVYTKAQIVAIGVFRGCQILGTTSYMQHFLVEAMEIVADYQVAKIWMQNHLFSTLTNYLFLDYNYICQWAISETIIISIVI